MKIICPQCRSNKLVAQGAMIEFSSAPWKCLNCGYQGPGLEIEKIKKKEKNKKDRLSFS